MLSLDLFDSKYERELREGAVDDLEYRRMNDLREKMEYLMQAYKKADTDEMRQAIMARYNEYKTEREGYMKVREQQVPSRQDPFAYVKPEPKGIGDIQDPKQKMAQLQQRSKKGPLANVAAGIKAFVKGEPEPMGEADNPLDQLPLPSQTRPTPRFGTRTHAQNVYFEILKAWDDERDYIVIPFPNAPNPVTMIRGQLWNAIVDLGSIKDPKRRAKYVEERFNDFESFMSWLGNLKRYKVPAKKKGKTQSLPLQIPQQPTGQAQPTAPGSPLMDPEFTGIKPPGNLQEKKKSSDLDAKDVGLSRELQKARARFPAAASDLEAGILDQMDQQQQAQQALAQQQADLNRQDQQIAGLAQVNQQQDGVMRAQGQEIDRLTQRLQQVMAQPTTAAAAAAPVTPQAEPTAPAATPAPDMVYVPDVPADTATQDREIARLNKQIQQLELMMALKTPAERSDLEDRIRDLEKARGEQEEKKRATAKKSAATRQRKKQDTTIDMEPAQAQLGFGASGDYLDPSAIIDRVRPKPEQGAEVAAAKDVIRKAQKSSRQQTVTNEGQPQELINRYLAIDAETDVEAVRKAIQAISKDPALSVTSKSRLLGQIGMIIQRHRLPIGRSYYTFMQQYMESVELDRNRVAGYPNDPSTVKHRLDTAKAILSDPRSDADSRREAAAIVAKSDKPGVNETVENVRAGMAKIYRRLAPKIERHRDSFLAGQLYDELESYAELHGAEGEFKRMMATARNSAHMEYDTNPGGFQNWFWFLPFEDEQLDEISRRDFLKGAGATAGAAALGAPKDVKAFPFDDKEAQIIGKFVQLYYFCSNKEISGPICNEIQASLRKFISGHPGNKDYLNGFYRPIFNKLQEIKKTDPAYYQKMIDSYKNNPAGTQEVIKRFNSLYEFGQGPIPTDTQLASVRNAMANEEMAEAATDDLKKRMSKLEALALAANRAGDDAKCKMYQQKIQSLKQKLSQSMSEGSKPGEYYIHTVYFKDGTKKRIRVTSDEVDVADYYTKRGQAVDRVDYDFQLHSDMTEQFATPGTTIPRKSVIQGYTVFFNPKTQVVSVTRGGDSEEAAIEQARVGTPSLKNFRQAADRLIDRIESDLNEAKEIQTREDFIRERDRLLRMISIETTPANKQILKSAIRQLENQAENEGWITIQSRMVREDSEGGEAVEMAIMRRMLVAHTDLIVEFGLDRVVDAIEEVAYNVGDVDEIGSSDVSGWVRQVKQILGVDA